MFLLAWIQTALLASDYQHVLQLLPFHLGPTLQPAYPQTYLVAPDCPDASQFEPVHLLSPIPFLMSPSGPPCVGCHPVSQFVIFLQHATELEKDHLLSPIPFL